VPERLLLVRHGESVWNAAGRWQGWADPPLSELGAAQAAEAAARLTGAALTAVVASDLRRAGQTAEIMAAHLDLGPVGIEPGLREFDVGDWTGLTRPEIAQRWPQELEAWNEGRLDHMPGGEPRDAFGLRVVAAVARVAEAAGPDGRVLVVTHGGTIRALERAAGAEPVRAANLSGRWFGVDAGGGIAAGERVILATPSTAPLAEAAEPELRK